jgi:antirestriction protein ArdC
MIVSDATENLLFYYTYTNLLIGVVTKSRCNRNEKYKAKFFENFDSKDKYAFEELVAEIGAANSMLYVGCNNGTYSSCNVNILNVWKDQELRLIQKLSSKQVLWHKLVLIIFLRFTTRRLL